ncbi:class I SAM-dependent DNA methyltransferase [Kaistella haifensis]|nr:class I SAM-dependent DNA methyltransferase [Kaistella haifensis]
MSKNLSPRQSLNKSFLKIKPNRIEIENFKRSFITLLDDINEKESEEFQKNLISNFLKQNAFEGNYFINTKGRNDLVIHNDKTAKSSVGVIMETKQSGNNAEMMTTKKLNTKAFQELVLYYLRERITHKNLEIKHLIATNVYEWFIFDANTFENCFAKNKNLVKQFEDFESKRLSGNTTDFFYSEIAKPFIDEVVHHIEYTHFNLRDYEKFVRNNNPKDDNQLIALFKILSPSHLLKLPFINDSNTLDKSFYNELLHIIGLTETKDGGKRLIERNKENQRNSGSLMEDTIIQLDTLDKVGRVKKSFLYGDNYNEKLFSIALELNITWINRVLFLKLLEGQLINYHKGDKSYAFLNFDKIKQYDDLNTLFFQVLAKRFEDRNSDVSKAFAKVPYLNSSLFEPTELEHTTLMISNLRDDKNIPILNSSVLKDGQGKKRTGELNTLQYLFEFLDAYDFASEGSEEIQEENKTIINASVLGLIFEKINGYKDGSFYTPGSITMYMSREVLRKAVLQKFNETKGWDCQNWTDLKEDINQFVKNYSAGRREARKELNVIFNSIRICDPAVGSGHFLVSVLNELIYIKFELNILVDRNFEVLNDYEISVENDELIIEADKVFFRYNPKNMESQRIQETLFHEKETIIENCLFGVDLNPNSVKICRLRLWIELLKNAYYKSETELETLPNIDINIKNGNSLISRFSLDSDLKSAFKKSKVTVEDYKNAVRDYKDAESKEKKRNLEKFLEDLKSDFRSEISRNSKEIKSLNLLRGEYYTKYGSEQLFEVELSKAQQKDKKDLGVKIRKLEDFIEEIKNNKIYENAFEWRFEFPEVLNDEGDFLGFDVIIGNPPYIQLQKMGAESDALEKVGYKTYAKTGDIYSLFYEQGNNVLKENGFLMFITSNKWMRAAYGESLRKFFVEKTNPLLLIDFSGNQIFDTATVDTNILMFAKQKNEFKTEACIIKEKLLNNLSVFVRQNSVISFFQNSDSWVILSTIEKQIKEKIERIGVPLKDWDISINYGIKTGFNDAFIISGEKRKELIEQDPKSEEIIRPIYVAEI